MGDGGPAALSKGRRLLRRREGGRRGGASEGGGRGGGSRRKGARLGLEWGRRFYMEKNRRWPSILRSTTHGDPRIHGLTFGPGGRGAWAALAACSSVCGLRAQHEIFAERNILGEEYLHVKFNLKIAKKCEIFQHLTWH
jgi:hypothetical protein